MALYGSFAAVSDQPFPDGVAPRRRGLLGFQRGGRPVFDESDPVLLALLDKLAAVTLRDQGESLRRAKGLWQVTDDDMVPEFKRFVR